jgi:hypothetical protein
MKTIRRRAEADERRETLMLAEVIVRPLRIHL